MNRRFRGGLALSLVAALGAFPAASVTQQVAQPEQSAVIRYERGMVIKAERGGFRNIVALRTVPMVWPDQQIVRVVKEEVPRGASVRYNTIDGVGRQMVVRIPFLAAGKEARVVVTFEIQPLPSPPPVEPAALRLPDASALDRKLACFLASSAYIESQDPKVRKVAAEITVGQNNAWGRVQTIHEWVKQNVKFVASAGKDRGASQTLRTRTTGDDADPKSLAVAMCRAQGIPARLVLIARPGASDHCYYEFYLVDADGNGHWLAADAAVEALLRPTKSERSVILQKGDNVTIIDPRTKRRVKHRFLADSLQGLPQTRGARLQLNLISRVVD